MRTALARVSGARIPGAPLRAHRVRLDLDAFSAAAQLHPDHVRRLVALGLIDADVDTAGHYRLAPSELARVARIERLRRDLGVTYAATGVVLDLLDRIEELEGMLRARRA